MYKTVRQGENSLQYTILPQTEELLIGGGMRGKGRDYSPSIHIRKSRRAEAAKGLLIAFCIVMAMVGLMVGSVTLLGYHDAPRARVTAAAERAASFVASVVGVSTYRDALESRKKELRMTEAASTLDVETTIETATVPPTAPTAPATEPRTKPVWSMPAFKLFWKSSTAAPTTARRPIPIVEDQDEFNIPNGPFSRVRLANRNQLDVIIRPTVTTEPTASAATAVQTVRTTQPENTPTTIPSTPKQKPAAPRDVLITTKWSEPTDQMPTVKWHYESADKNYPKGKNFNGLKDKILDDDDDEEFQEINEDELFKMNPYENAAVMKRLNAYYEKQRQSTVSKNTAQIPKMWPFEPSMTMFQWPDYHKEDSMIVPLLVGTATLLMMATVLSCVVVRRRREQAKGATHMSKLASDLPEDNTNLLTAESQEDE